MSDACRPTEARVSAATPLPPLVPARSPTYVAHPRGGNAPTLRFTLSTRPVPSTTRFFRPDASGDERRKLVWVFGLTCLMTGASLTEIGDHLATGGARLWWTVGKSVCAAALALWTGRVLGAEIARGAARTPDRTADRATPTA